MADTYLSEGAPAYQIDNDRVNKILDESFQEFSQMQLWRNTFAAQWEEVAELILPNYRNTFYYGNFNWPGQKKTDRQVDASGMVALSRFGAILDSLLTPRNMTWHALSASDPYLMKDRRTKLWFLDTTRRLFRYRYMPIANFASQNQQNFQLLGAFGTGGMFIDQAVDGDNRKIRALRYKAIPLGELFIRENHQGLVDGYIRWFRMTAEQAIKMFGKERVPPTILAAAEKKSQTPFNFLHRVCPNTDYETGKLDYRQFKYVSYYISIEGRALMSEGGYTSLPIAITRYEQAPGEVYGRSPAMNVLPALKTLNAEKSTFLKQGHRAADPVLLTADDGLVDLSLRPGAINKGGVTEEGRPKIIPLVTGNIQVTLEMMQEEKTLINDTFLVTLFQIMTENPQMTATEVIERTNEKGILLAPTVGRQQSEYLGPMIDRELDLMSRLGLLSPMPPALLEAKGDYQVIYTSPLSRAQRAQEAAGFMRTVESVKELVQITGDSSLLDPFDFDTAIPGIAEIQAVPEDWMADQQQIAQKRDARAKQAQVEQQIKAAPAQAAMMKAQAVAAKQSGGQAPQTMPAQQQGMPG